MGYASQHERNVENQSPPNFQLNGLGGRSGESFGLSFNHIFTLCEPLKPILPLGITRGIQLQAVLTNVEPDLRVRHAASLRIQHSSSQTLRMHGADEAQHGPKDDDELMHEMPPGRFPSGVRRVQQRGGKPCGCLDLSTRRLMMIYRGRFPDLRVNT